MRTNSAMTRVDIYSWFSNAMDGNNLLVFLFLLIIGGIYSVRKHELKKNKKQTKNTTQLRSLNNNIQTNLI